MFGCCCTCEDGGTVSRWLNSTLVRPVGDDTAPGKPHYNVSPYPRTDTFHSVFCSGKPNGKCGNWLVGGDKLGVSQQLVEDTVDDILACATPDSTHVTDDHNCYSKSGTKSMRSKRFGGRWIHALKYWQGRSGFVDATDPNTPSGITFDAGDWDTHVGFTGVTTTFQTSPPQSRYLSADITTAQTDKSITVTTWPTLSTTTQSVDLTGSASVSRYSGIETRSNSYSDTNFGAISSSSTYGHALFTFLAGLDMASAVAYFAGFNTAGASGWTYAFDGGTTYTLTCPTYSDSYVDWLGNTIHFTVPEYVAEEITITFGSLGADLSRTVREVGARPTVDGGTASINTRVVETMTVRNAQIVYSYIDNGFYAYDPASGNWFVASYQSKTGTVTLSNAYTSADVLTDFYSVMAEWNASDHSIQKWRTDEKLGLGALCVYDEVLGSPSLVVLPRQAGVSSASGPTMDDYSGTVSGGIWPQRAWIDSRNFIWRYPNNSTLMPVGFTGGATLVTPTRGGSKISHTQAGSDRHFWFGFIKLDGSLTPDTNGDYSPSELPETAQRWMDIGAAGYFGGGDHSGNYPQSFLKQRDRILVGCKYFEVPWKWPSVNYGFPAHKGLYAVEQTTVCCVVSGSPGGTIVIKKTGEANAPLAADGLANGNTVVIGGVGVYVITGLTDNHDGTWNMTVGSLVAAIPSGFEFRPGDFTSTGYVGAVRWTSPTSYTDDETSQHTAVRQEWTFDNRKATLAAGLQPNWAGGSGAGTGTGIVGCLSYSVSQFTYELQGACPPVIGYAPFYSGSPLENFGVKQKIYTMPSSFNFDDNYGALWLGAVETVMVDPFWEKDFRPDCDSASWGWVEDDGSRATDGSDHYYPHRRWVEAASTVPGGKTLPGSLKLFYDPSNIISPPYYVPGEGGIPADGSDYASVARPWGFVTRVGGSGNRFWNFYSTFVTPAP